MPAIVTVGAQLMARALVTKLRIPDTAAQTRKSPVARSGRAEASCHDISNTWLAHGYSSSSLTTPATQSVSQVRSPRGSSRWFGRAQGRKDLEATNQNGLMVKAVGTPRYKRYQIDGKRNRHDTQGRYGGLS